MAGIADLPAIVLTLSIITLLFAVALDFARIPLSRLYIQKGISQGLLKGRMNYSTAPIKSIDPEQPAANVFCELGDLTPTTLDNCVTYAPASPTNILGGVSNHFAESICSTIEIEINRTASFFTYSNLDYAVKCEIFKLPIDSGTGLLSGSPVSIASAIKPDLMASEFDNLANEANFGAKNPLDILTTVTNLYNSGVPTFTPPNVGSAAPVGWKIFGSLQDVTDSSSGEQWLTPFWISIVIYTKVQSIGFANFATLDSLNGVSNPDYAIVSAYTVAPMAHIAGIEPIGVANN